MCRRYPNLDTLDMVGLLIAHKEWPQLLRYNGIYSYYYMCVNYFLLPSYLVYLCFSNIPLLLSCLSLLLQNNLYFYLVYLCFFDSLHLYLFVSGDAHRQSFVCSHVTVLHLSGGSINVCTLPHSLITTPVLCLTPCTLHLYSASLLVPYTCTLLHSLIPTPVLCLTP